MPGLLTRVSEDVAITRVGSYRMWAYALIAIGLINWDYQRAQPNIAVHSLLIIAPGATLLALSCFKSAEPLVGSRVARIVWMLIGSIAITYALINK